MCRNQAIRCAVKLIRILIQALQKKTEQLPLWTTYVYCRFSKEANRKGLFKVEAGSTTLVHCIINDIGSPEVHSL